MSTSVQHKFNQQTYKQADCPRLADHSVVVICLYWIEIFTHQFTINNDVILVHIGLLLFHEIYIIVEYNLLSRFIVLLINLLIP